MPDVAPHPSPDVDRDPIHRDPSAWGEMLAGVYREIGERAMRDLPIFNDALGVEAVGFRRFDRAIVGIMITPWFMNVIATVEERSPHRSGATQRLVFPAGEIEFTISDVAPAGRIASCSLFSPMFQFDDMAAARATAEAAITALMTPSDNREEIKAADTSTIDRRNFLRGVLTERPA
jgi:[NiFe] hydrogenase assembly HybE family chaperone